MKLFLVANGQHNGKVEKHAVLADVVGPCVAVQLADPSQEAQADVHGDISVADGPQCEVEHLIDLLNDCFLFPGKVCCCCYQWCLNCLDEVW